MYILVHERAAYNMNMMVFLSINLLIDEWISRKKITKEKLAHNRKIGGIWLWWNKFRFECGKFVFTIGILVSDYSLMQYYILRHKHKHINFCWAWTKRHVQFSNNSFSGDGGCETLSPFSFERSSLWNWFLVGWWLWFDFRAEWWKKCQNQNCTISIHWVETVINLLKSLYLSSPVPQVFWVNIVHTKSSKYFIQLVPQSDEISIASIKYNAANSFWKWSTFIQDLWQFSFYSSSILWCFSQHLEIRRT